MFKIYRSKPKGAWNSHSECLYCVSYCDNKCICKSSVFYNQRVKSDQISCSQFMLSGYIRTDTYAQRNIKKKKITNSNFKSMDDLEMMSCKTRIITK